MAMVLEVDVARSARLLQGALTAKDSEETLKICEDFEMEVPPAFSVPTKSVFKRSCS